MVNDCLETALLSKRDNGKRVRALWHMLPLHRLPRMLLDGAILSADRLAAATPPLSARSRNRDLDRTIGVSDHVHLYIWQKTVMLRDKMEKGYPHVMIAFPLSIVAGLDNVGFLPTNPLGRMAIQGVENGPVWSRTRAAEILGMDKRLGNASILIPSSISFSEAIGITCFSEQEAAIVRNLGKELGVALPPVDVIISVVNYQPVTLTTILSYFEECRIGQSDWRNPPGNIIYD